MIDLKKIDKTWTLFLDRDGVINDEKQLDYINTWKEFKFFTGTKEAIKNLTERFGNIFIVTNQRGVAKGVTKMEDLEIIHRNMIKEIEAAGGRVTKIYFCTDIENSSPNRKPNPGMGWQAKKEFPEVDFSKSIMVGNTLSDMEFGRNVGIALNIFIPSTHPNLGEKHPMVDAVYPDLMSLAKAI